MSPWGLRRKQTREWHSVGKLAVAIVSNIKEKQKVEKVDQKVRYHFNGTLTLIRLRWKVNSGISSGILKGNGKRRGISVLNPLSIRGKQKMISNVNANSG